MILLRLREDLSRVMLRARAVSEEIRTAATVRAAIRTEAIVRTEETDRAAREATRAVIVRVVIRAATVRAAASI